MSHHQSKADRSSDAQQRRGGRPGGSALNYQRASNAKGGSGGGHGTSASAALLPPTTTSAVLQAAPLPSTKRSNAANGQSRGFSHSGFEQTDSQRAQQNSSSQHQPQQNTGTRHSKQPPPVTPLSMNGTTASRSTKPGTPSGAFATEAAGNVTKPAVSGDLSWNTVHPQLTFQFGSIGPGFMHGTGIQIPARTSSAPPNLDEQKQDQARFEAANAAAGKVTSGPTQQAAGSHVQPSSTAGGLPPVHLVHSQVQHPVQVQFTQANSHAQPQAAVSTPAHLQMQAQLVTAAQVQQQGLVQLPYSQQALHPQQGPGQTIKFPQPMATLPGQMMAPQLASLPGQLSAQQMAQLPHQLGSQLPGGLPAAQYGLAVPSSYIQPRMSRAVKIVHPETHEELKFDSKITKPDTHMDSGATVGGAGQNRVVSNGPSHVRTSLGYASGAHHQLNMNVYSSQQNGPYAHSSPHYYQAPVTANSVVSTAVTGAAAPRQSFSEASQGQRGSIQNVNLSVATSNTKPISSASGSFTAEAVVAEQNLGSLNQAGLMSDAASQVSVDEKNVKSAKEEESSTVPVTDVKQGSETVQEAAAGVQASTAVKLEGSSSGSRKDPASLRDQSKEAHTDSLRHKDSNRVDSSGQGTSEVKPRDKKKKKKEASKADAGKSVEGHKVQDADGKKQVEVKAVQLPKAVTAPTGESNVSGAVALKIQEESELSTNEKKSAELAAPASKLDSESVSNIELVAVGKGSTTITADTQESVLDDESQTKAAAESRLDVSMGLLTLENPSPKDTGEKDELPNLEEPHKKVYHDDKGDALKESANMSLLPVPHVEPVGDAIESCISESVDVASSGLEKVVENGLEIGGAGFAKSSTSGSAEPSTSDGASPKESAQSQLDLSTDAHQVTSDISVDLPSDKDSHTGDVSVSALPDIRQGSKKKKLKDVLAKADAASNTSDLYTAYKAPEEKKVDDAKVVKAATEASIESTRSSAMVEEKALPKEVDDWEDAAELPSPKVSSTTADSTAGRDTTASEGAEKYTRDFLLTFKDQNTDLPLDFDVRADIVELLQNPQAVALQYAERDTLRSSGRMLDRQLSGGLRRGNSSNNFEDERWNRPLGPYGSGHMDMGPLGGFRPGSSQGLIARMPSSIRPGISVPTFVPGLIPGKPLPSPMTPATPGLARTNTADSDRWQRLPQGQKGLIPSPQTPLPQIHKAEKRYEVSKVSDEEELKQRQMKGILNKLTPQNFDKLFEQVKDVKIQSVVTLTGVISQIFDKALLEPTFCEMYAKFCVQLAVDMPEFFEDGVKVTFKRVLLNKCQEEFHRGEREESEANNLEEDGVEKSKEEREEKRLKAKRRMLGNIRFIGELYKKSMLTEKIMHECIRKLIGGNANPEEEDVEALCKLMSTIGHMIDHPKAKDAINSYFERMTVFSCNQRLSSRLRFMLKDVIDLRRNNWQERRKVEGPKKIDEVRRDAVQERQATVAQAGRMSRGSTIGTSAGRRIGALMDFGMRGPASPVYSPSTPMGNVPALGSGRGVQLGIRGPYAQDVRMEDRLLLDSRTAPMPLSQRPVDEGPITLGPQGGLGRGITMRGTSSGSGRSALADASAEGRRFGPGTMSAYGPAAVGSREEVSHKGMMSERPVTPSERPLLDRPGTADRYVSGSSARGVRSLERTLSDRSVSTSAASTAHSNRPSTAPAVAHLNEEQLKEKSESALIEYFSARDQKEVALCIEELRAPKFHATMVCNWIALSFEKKSIERDLLVKLLINLHPSLLKQEHIVKGFQMVLELFEDLVVDTPKAPEYVAEMLVKIILTDVISLDQAANLLKIEPIREIGVGIDMIIMILSGLQQDAGEQVVLDKYKSSTIRFEDFMSSNDRHKRSIPEMLQKKNLLFLNQDVDAGISSIQTVGEQLMDHLKGNEPVAETSKWLERNLTPAMKSDSAFLRMLMSSVLKHCIPNLSSTYEREESKELVKRLSHYGTLLRKFASDKEKEWQYIIAMQLFAHERGHPAGLMTMLFNTLYESEVISESAYFKWEDDVKDSTPGRDKALRDVYRWLEWLRTAPELTQDSDD